MRLILLVPAGAALLTALASCSSSPASKATAPNRSRPTPTPSLWAGTDLTACALGTCVVRVSAGAQITFKQPDLGLDTLRVTSVQNGVATVETTSTGNGGDGTAYATGKVCDINDVNGDTTDSMSAGCRLTNNGLGMSVLSIDGDTAVLRLEPAS